jgi:hypothetical protein
MMGINPGRNNNDEKPASLILLNEAFIQMSM